MIEPTIESILEDKENNSVYTIVVYRQLTYEEMITAFAISIGQHIRAGKLG